MICFVHMSRKTGLTLIEVIVAIVIIAIGAVAALQFYVFCQKSFLTSAITRPMAANFGRETMEDLYLRDYSDTNLAPNNYSVTMPVTPTYGRNWTQTYTVTNSTSPEPDYKIITVPTDWTQ